MHVYNLHYMSSLSSLSKSSTSSSYPPSDSISSDRTNGTNSPGNDSYSGIGNNTMDELVAELNSAA